MGSSQSSTAFCYTEDENGYAVVPDVHPDGFTVSNWVARNKDHIRQGLLPCRERSTAGVKITFFKWQWNIFVGLFASLQSPKEPVFMTWIELDLLLMENMLGGGGGGGGGGGRGESKSPSPSQPASKCRRRKRVQAAPISHA